MPMVMMTTANADELKSGRPFHGQSHWLQRRPVGLSQFTLAPVMVTVPFHTVFGLSPVMATPTATPTTRIYHL